MFTPVILVCVHDLEDHVSVPHSLLYEVFSPYGQVLRILIFERSATLKALVEYNNINGAILAKKNLNRSFLFNGSCRISIYPSNFQTIRFQNNHYPGGVDYTLTDSHQYSTIPLEKPFPIGLHITPEKTATITFSPRSMYDGGSSRSFSNGASSPSYSHSTTEEDVENGEDILQMINRHHEEIRTCDNEGTCFETTEEKDEDNYNQVFENDFSSIGTFQKNFTRPSFSTQGVRKSPQNSSSFSNMRGGRFTCIPQSPSQFHNSAKHFSLPPNYLIPRFSEHSNNSPYGSFEEIPRGFDYFEDRRQMPSQFSSKQQNISSFNQKENKNQSNLTVTTPTSQNKLKDNSNTSSKSEEEIQCPVLHVLGIENKEVSTKMLHNVFSNFGNIVKLIFIKTRAVALVEFENIASAAFAKEHLNQVDFFGKPLRITYSKYPTIQLQPGQGEKYPDQLIIGDDKSFRFKEGKNVAITPPSCLLHVSNLTKESCKDKKALANLFGMYGEVQNVKSLFGESGKNMCLVKMKSLEECLKAMAQLHDTDFGGRKLQVSFSHSKN